jgi:Ca2+-transporting ATPase
MFFCAWSISVLQALTTCVHTGTAILVAVIVVVMVGSINDYQKESQFRALNAKKDNIKVTVIRGGKDEVISCHDVVVGDIYKLSTGDVITADGYVIGCVAA